MPAARSCVNYKHSNELNIHLHHEANEQLELATFVMQVAQ